MITVRTRFERTSNLKAWRRAPGRILELLVTLKITHSRADLFSVNRFAYFILVLGGCLPAAYLAMWHVANQMALATGSRVDQNAIFSWTAVISISTAIFLSLRQGRKKRKKERCHTIRCVSLRFRN